eukprot:3727904-Pleurochrysis_carterae.AAC.1
MRSSPAWRSTSSSASNAAILTFRDLSSSRSPAMVSSKLSILACCACDGAADDAGGAGSKDEDAETDATAAARLEVA